MKNYKLCGRIWLTLNGETVIGEGKIMLLKNIEQLGSLHKAAETMQMSYRKAWYSVKTMNKNALEPLVILTRGGKDGGSAQITPFGKALLHQFEQYQTAFKKFLQTKNSDGQ